MATPTFSQVLTQINTYIVANGNNEITANVLNPILKLLLDFSNNTIGDLDTLTTDQKETVVAALNSLKANINSISEGFVKLHTGVDNPNITPPDSYNYADFYMQLDSLDSSPIALWQWNGFEWLDYSQVPATTSDNVENNSDVAGSSVTDALNTLATSSIKVPKITFIADGVQDTFDIGVAADITAVFADNGMLSDANWNQTGSSFTLSYVPQINTEIKPI